MKVLVVGSGGREHALAWKLGQSAMVSRVFAAPGNPGIAADGGELVNLSADDIAGLLAFAKQNAVDLTVIGPEAPLVAGIVDAFESERLKAFGPGKRAALLEGSKSFAKKLMRSNSVPSGDFKEFTAYEQARAYVEERAVPLVVKADGLAAGKGVTVCHTRQDALAAVELAMRGEAFGEAGAKVIVEDFLVGEEASVLALTDGRTIYALEPAQDHKPIFDGDEGPNTGGMGAYSPAPIVTEKIARQVERDVLLPTIHGLNRDRRPYSGVLYAGLMINGADLNVLEFNCRFGDPETQPILMRLTSDLAAALLAVTEGRLEQAELAWDTRAAVCVVMASGGYPGSYEKGFEISGIDRAERDPDVKVFHAGTERAGGKLVTAGGRVLGVTALGDTIADAKRRAYAAVEKIHFEGACYRTDISDKALR